MTAKSDRLRALVIEDEWPARNYLVELIEASEAAHAVGAFTSASEALEALRGAPDLADVLFVDVQLTGDDSENAGLELVREVAGWQNPPACVLATASPGHALEAFQLGVVDYITKPFTEERVRTCLGRVASRRPAGNVDSAPLDRIVARRKRNLVFLEPEEVWAFEAADRLTFVHTRYGKFDVELSLSAIEASVGRALLRVHRNWLVNAEHVRELERGDSELVLRVGRGIGDDHIGVRVPVARERAQSVRESLLATATGLRRH